jgi:DNA-binding CsgD family transcriptional regulator
MRLSDFIAACEAARDETMLLRELQGFVAAFGADLVSYHIVTENLHHLDLREGFQFHTFPQVWVDRYVERDYYSIDPIIQACMQSREPFHWYDVGDRIRLTPEQKAYLKDLHAHGMVDGFAVPVYSHNATSAYFGVGSTKTRLDLSEAQAMEIMFACLHVHNEFLERREAPPTATAALSPREREVLTLIARGRSNSAIARELEISDNTVDTLVRRTFIKLGVADRVSAALKAVGMGVIRI